MQPRSPSRTARQVAALRAAHQTLDHGHLFHDPLAVRMLGADSEELLSQLDTARTPPGRRGFRLFIAARSRFAEDQLAAAVARGVRQLVVLGAGLDTFAYRNPHEAAGLAVFEVDHPATQEWKRERLSGAGIPLPPSLTFAPVDFERENLGDGLAAAGFDPARPAFFSWLGVVPYLTREAVFGTLGHLAGLPGGAEAVFDYSEPPSAMPPSVRAAHSNRAARVAALGEPFLSYFAPEELAADLREAGFAAVEDLDAVRLLARYADHSANGSADRAPAEGERRSTAHVLRAATAG
ncbi:class I SAM-dependent methyltransferase [Streptomyces sp. NBS 14/10]|uniref:class I SAM-dependent methyltransferase n=1 Tax=Streptomyces sp. NBS 14/10 TaxID=1945643 RepID=UPI000B7E24AE|nr:class I SAM-dependent methyltransferase [Streptomyces sp. NBS 14/10]KAK1178324.1 class I SAM-dependent methyltransferase [Streptomyces sp. NBS 14/10]